MFLLVSLGLNTSYSLWEKSPHAKGSHILTYFPNKNHWQEFLDQLVDRKNHLPPPSITS